jgi:hypothetical protein
MQCGHLLNVVRINAGYGLHYAVEPDRVIFGLPTKQSFLKNLIVALGKTLNKLIMSNDAITPFDNPSLATPVKPCLFQSSMNTMLGSLIFLLENTIP